MRRSVAGQSIGVQMITAADGTAFTGAVSVAVTVDSGTQGAGGGTGPTHEGNGYHSYIPTQAETNGVHLAFTFTGTGAVPVTVQVYTIEPRLDRSSRSIVLVTVGAGSTTTSIVTSSMDPPVVDTDQFRGLVLKFDKDTTTTGLRGQGTTITGISSGGVITVEALTSAPVSGDTAVIL